MLIEERVWKEVEKLGTCEYNADVFSAVLQKIQDKIWQTSLDQRNAKTMTRRQIWEWRVEKIRSLRESLAR